jgi:hypothetical protein
MTKISGKETSKTNGLPLPKSFPYNKGNKSSNGHKMNDSYSEMQSLLSQLKELVPNIPRNRKVSKLEIIQHVIDYIFDLQLALQSHPQSINKYG